MVSKAIEMGCDELLRLFVYLYGPSSTSILVSDSWGSFVLLRFPSSLFISFPSSLSQLFPPSGLFWHLLLFHLFFSSLKSERDKVVLKSSYSLFKRLKITG